MVIISLVVKKIKIISLSLSIIIRVRIVIAIGLEKLGKIYRFLKSKENFLKKFVKNGQKLNLKEPKGDKNDKNCTSKRKKTRCNPQY